MELMMRRAVRDGAQERAPHQVVRRGGNLRASLVISTLVNPPITFQINYLEGCGRSAPGRFGTFGHKSRRTYALIVIRGCIQSGELSRQAGTDILRRQPVYAKHLVPGGMAALKRNRAFGNSQGLGHEYPGLFIGSAFDRWRLDAQTQGSIRDSQDPVGGGLGSEPDPDQAAAFERTYIQRRGIRFPR